MPDGSASLSFFAADGYPLRGQVWRHTPATEQQGGASRPVVLINPATSVRAGYYHRFATWLHRHGFDVVNYDYRGIGDSRPPGSLRALDAGWIDWGQLDFEAALQHALQAFPGQPVHVVAHSVGGHLIGMAPSNHRIARIVTIGAQFAHWRDYAPRRRAFLLLKWHLAMPALTALFGYFPGQRLGWLEDTPRGVVRDWTAREPRFEDGYRPGSWHVLSDAQRQALVDRYAQVTAPMLALSVADDEFATVSAVQRLLNYYRNSPRTHWHIEPGDIGERSIGHFAFFHSHFETKLWPLALGWLEDGALPADAPGAVVAPR